jgi:hypothetical protein
VCDGAGDGIGLLTGAATADVPRMASW